MYKNFFKNKKVLITGIHGFVGSHLAKTLTDLGADVYGISVKSDSSKVLQANILDFSLINDFIKENKIQICYHLAGISLVEQGQKDPHYTFKVNTEGTLNVLESARLNNLERVVIASTAHVYGNNKPPSLERHIPRPSRPYETSKACTDLIAQSYADTFDLPVLIPRFVNIYGPGDLNFNRLIPKTIKSVIEDMPPTMWGGDAIRDYLYIDDAISAYLTLGSCNIDTIKGSRVFNFGGGNKISVEELIGKIVKLSGKSLSIDKIEQERVAEIKQQYVSFAKARNILGWKPLTLLEDGLKTSIKWYDSYFNDLQKQGS